MLRIAAVSLALLISCSGASRRATAAPSQDEFEALTILRSLIAINTYNPPGNELQICDWVAGLFEGLPVETRIYESAPGRANLVVRYRGNGSRQPVLLMAHIDTVNVQPENWQTDPLVAAIADDGYLYGRGSIDDKGMAACLIASLLRIARDRLPLSRDVILLLTADEEAGGDFGVKFMIEHHLDDIRAEFALNEGGRTQMEEDGTVRAVLIQCAEKSMHNVFLRTTGTSGHSSVPNGDNPIETLAYAIHRIAQYRAPARINAVSAGYFRGQSEIADDDAVRAAMGDITNPQDDVVQAAANRLSEANNFYNAVLRNTATTTIVDAGIRFNVIPSTAEATVNVRLLPGTNLEDFLAELTRWIGRENVRFEPETPPDRREAEPDPSSPDTDMFRAVERAARAIWPEIVVMPMMSTGATDSRDLRLQGIPSYGILPMPLTEEDERRMHADNERVRVESLRSGAEFQHRIILEIAQ